MMIENVMTIVDALGGDIEILKDIETSDIVDC